MKLKTFGDEVNGQTFTVSLDWRSWLFGVNVEPSPTEVTVVFAFGPVALWWWRDRCVVEPTPERKHPLLHKFVPVRELAGSVCALARRRLVR
jgi:hypothetical protein